MFGFFATRFSLFVLFRQHYQRSTTIVTITLDRIPWTCSFGSSSACPRFRRPFERSRYLVFAFRCLDASEQLPFFFIWNEAGEDRSKGCQAERCIIPGRLIFLSLPDDTSAVDPG